MSFSFPKARRLNDSAAYKAVFDQVDKKFFIKGALILVKVRDKLSISPRLGLIISKKNVPLSCQRNVFKRVIRESFRLNQSCLAGLDIIVLVKRDILNLDRKSLRQALNQLWQSLIPARRKF